MQLQSKISLHTIKILTKYVFHKYILTHFTNIISYFIIISLFIFSER